MNARQKAKKYKRMYEMLLNQPVKFVKLEEEHHKIDTLHFCELLPDQFISIVDGEYVREVVANEYARELVKHFNEYVDYYIEKLPYEQSFRLRCQIKILRRANYDNNNS